LLEKYNSAESLSAASLRDREFSSLYANRYGDSTKFLPKNVFFYSLFISFVVSSFWKKACF